MPGLHGLFNSLIGRGINKINHRGETRLFEAARAGNIAQVKKCLRDGADSSICNHDGLTPLHIAAYWGENEIVDVLLKAGADPNADNGKGWTPLHSAALSGGMKSRKYIIESLKRAGARDDVKDKYGFTAADYMILWAENADAAAKLKLYIDAENAKLHPSGNSSFRPKGPGAPIH